ncbi:lysophosphatidylserine lipase ABHD12-like [Diorhabda carinulata]|uniref:lysophosphatidylserine lipase ABHD12-like n=1 Tax=Diorhabda carinulata TaxID=1163345 RepID=UPI0025A2260D|nr:lysophosphatidylserine lipase ABHD12-like [Diorhabda carinulata]
MSRHRQFREYCLVNDCETEAEDNDVLFPDLEKQKCNIQKCICVIFLTLVGLGLVVFLLVFILFPLIFMSSKTLQTDLVFTHFNLPKDPKYFQTRHFPAYKNRYVTFNYTKDNENQTLGMWQILPVNLAYDELYGSVDFDEALLNSNYNVLIYFHGTGEARSYNEGKYGLLSYFFHIITFDYRSYADSSKGELTEDKVIDDCIELYKWVKNRTHSDIYVWGHSLGAALATRTVASLENLYGVKTKGLVIESGFTTLHDELYVHPYVKIFTWLPWFNQVIVNPLYNNGFIFDTVSHLLTITSPVMVLHAEDDNEIPCSFGRKLVYVAETRNITTIYHEFDRKYGYKHNYLYKDPFMKLYIMNFIDEASNRIL